MEKAAAPRRVSKRASALQVKSAARDRREEEKRRRQQDILSAAKRVYSRKGFLSATIEDIAAEARVSVGTIYLYYRSKEELYVSLLFESMTAFTEALTAIQSSRRRPDRKLREAWKFFYRFRQEFPESYRIFFLLHQPTFPAAISPATVRALNRHAGRNFALAAAIVKAAMDAGIYRNGNPRDIVDLLWSLFMGVVHLSEIRENLGLRMATLEEIHARAFEWIEAGLLNRGA